MRRFRAIAFATAIALVAGPARPEVALPTMLQVLGSVSDAAHPVANALVVALNLNSFDTIQTYTTADGSFSLPPLKAGVYKIIAVKHGFLPAIATIVPSRPDHHVKLRLQTEKQSKSRTANDEVWEVRGSLPPDVLREIDQVLADPPVRTASYEVPRFRGEMMSMTGMASARQAEGPAYAQTVLGVQSRIGDSWQFGIHGDLQRFDDPTDNQTFGQPVAESSAVSMELRSSSTDAYRVTSARSTWRYAEPMHQAAADEQADLQAHNFEWQHGDSRVNVRYFAHENLSRAMPFGSDVIEIAGDTPVLQTERNGIGVSLRVRQESIRNSATDALRTADIAANGSLDLVPSFTVHYGMASRLGLDRTEWAPSTGVEWKVSRATALVASGSYKVVESVQTLLPAMVTWSDDLRVMPSYSYSFGFVSNHDQSNRLSAIATVSATDEPMRMILEGTQQFWDSLYLDAGDVRRDLRVSYRHDFGRRFAVDVTTAAGTATPREAQGMQKVYVTGDVQSLFSPTRTMLEVSYREIQQPQRIGGEYKSSRVNVRMSQSLYLPIDMKVLLGVELVRAENSPFLLDTLIPEQTSKKYMGGLALNF